MLFFVFFFSYKNSKVLTDKSLKKKKRKEKNTEPKETL